MRRNPCKAMAVGVCLVAFLSLLSGCAGKTDAPLARRLNQNEADKLVRLYGARRLNPDTKALKTAKGLESHGDTLALAGDWQAASFQYQRALPLAKEGQRRRLLSKLGELYLRQGLYHQARQAFERLTSGGGAGPHAWQGLGLALLALGRGSDARQALLKAVKQRPSLWKAHNGLGIIYNHLHQPALARDAFSRALRYQPKRAELYNNRALAYVGLGEYGKAEVDFRRAVELKPDFKLAYNNLALLLVRQGRYQEALRAFSRAEGAAQAHNNLGVLLAWQGRYQEAAHSFSRALESAPRYYPQAREHLEAVRQKVTSYRRPLTSPFAGAPQAVQKDILTGSSRRERREKNPALSGTGSPAKKRPASFLSSRRTSSATQPSAMGFSPATPDCQQLAWTGNDPTARRLMLR